MDKEFYDLVSYIRNSVPISMTDNEKLDFYKYYKQATIGDCNTDQPMFYQVTERSKWDAWNSIKGLTKKEAMVNYIMLAKEKLILVTN
tara:strand:+ start:5517 stop:5780 length:264 start_codon:yes stop_codon:yes gene_type:complete